MNNLIKLIFFIALNIVFLDVKVFANERIQEINQLNAETLKVLNIGLDECKKMNFNTNNGGVLIYKLMQDYLLIFTKIRHKLKNNSTQRGSPHTRSYEVIIDGTSFNVKKSYYSR